MVLARSLLGDYLDLGRASRRLRRIADKLDGVWRTDSLLPSGPVSQHRHDCWFCRRHVVLVRLVRQLVGHDYQSSERFGAVSEVLARTLSLDFAQVRLGHQPGGYQTVSTWGEQDGDPARFPVTYHGNDLGVVLVCRPAEELTAEERFLIHEFTSGLAVALHVARVNGRLRESRRRVLSVRDDERSRLRRDIHDRLGPVLTAGRMRVEAVRSMVDSPPPVTRLLGDLLQDLDNAVGEVRRIADALAPLALASGGLWSAVYAQVARFEHSCGGDLVVQVCIPCDAVTLSPSTERAVYQIVSEALTNVVKHAKARQCAVRIDLDQDVCVEVTDDGAGLPKSYVSGVGMSSMRQRAVELGGRFAVENVRPHGTKVTARLPYTATDAARAPDVEDRP